MRERCGKEQVSVSVSTLSLGLSPCPAVPDEGASWGTCVSWDTAGSEPPPKHDSWGTGAPRGGEAVRWDRAILRGALSGFDGPPVEGNLPYHSGSLISM